nr:WD-40 repeat protein [uncultured bacterium]
MKSPFKFLDAFTLEDSEQFFGRDKEIKALYKMVFETPLILIYGLSGTGKTSLVQCGLASRFDGPDWFPFFVRRNENINDSLDQVLDECIEDPQERSLVEKVSYLNTSYFRPVYLIFDQFEELFILGEEEEQIEFVQNIKQLLKAKLPCKVILIIREEYLGQLYNFEKQIPTIFDFRLRVEPMSAKTTKTVLKTSFDQFNIHLEEPEEDRLQQIVDNISEGQSGIQLPYLQVYLDMLYRKKFKKMYPQGSEMEYPRLEFSTQEITKFGKIENVLDKFLEDQKNALQLDLEKQYQVDDSTVHDLLNMLVTDEGTKRPIYFSRVGEQIKVNAQFSILLPNLNEEILSYAIVSLEKRRIIRFTNNDQTFELAHDSLANLIDQKRTDEQRQRNEVLRALLNNFKEYDQSTDLLLSAKQLARYEPYLPALNLDDEVKDFIHKSEEYVVFLERKAQEDAAEKERVVQERKTAKLRKKLMWVIGMFALLALFSAFIAVGQRDTAIDAKEAATLNFKKSVQGNYQNIVGAGQTLKAKGKFTEAIAQLQRAKNYAFRIFEVNGQQVECEFTNPPRDSLQDYIANWENANTLLKDGDDLYEKSTDNNQQDGDDLLLLQALTKYQQAFAIEAEKYIDGKIQHTTELINQKYQDWLLRAGQFTHYKQCAHAKEALRMVKQLNLESENEARQKEIEAIQKKLKKRRGCY